MFSTPSVLFCRPPQLNSDHLSSSQGGVIWQPGEYILAIDLFTLYEDILMLVYSSWSVFNLSQKIQDCTIEAITILNPFQLFGKV